MNSPSETISPGRTSGSLYSNGNSNGSRRRSSVYTNALQQQQQQQDILDTHTQSMRQAARELLAPSLRSRRSIVDVRSDQSSFKAEASSNVDAVSHLLGDAESSLGNVTYGTIEEDEPLLLQKVEEKAYKATISVWEKILNQTTAVAMVCLLNMMIAIPFGASYFPVGWRTAGSEIPNNEEDADNVNGIFPLGDRQAIGIRMFLFSTLIGQFAFTFASKFTNPVGLQMLENVPFFQEICHTVIANQGYGIEALSTVFFIFGLSSVIVGLTFYMLGHLQLGRIVYFFPNHVLIGCIGGIGVFIIITAIEVTSDITLKFDMDGLISLKEKFHLLAIVLLFEGTLRVLIHLTEDKDGRPKYPYLSPLYYCLITPIFYLGLTIFGISVEEAQDEGYFFPALEDVTPDTGSSSSDIWNDNSSLWEIFQIINLSTISWISVFQSIGTMIALAAFSLIHVPINIPAFAISTDVEVDMNAELKAHGYSNCLAGLFGGLQNYTTYSNSVLYAKSGGDGKISSLLIVAFTGVLYVIGPDIASFLPRCMAGTLLLHIGIDLVLEGVYDSFGQYDQIEYAGIWVITIVMTTYGMSAALIAGVIAALSTYAVQSINYQNPIRQIFSASTLRSSDWNRSLEARDILDNTKTGRSRILIFQLQGHIFFGNIAQLTDTIKAILKEREGTEEVPIAVIVDFTLVVGMDSSAAHAVAKLKKIIHRLFGVEISIFVTGSGRGGFPCEYALTKALSSEAVEHVNDAGSDWNNVAGDQELDQNVSVSPGTASVNASKVLSIKRTDGRVCESLDDALRFAEDILIARVNPNLGGALNDVACIDVSDLALIDMTLDEEQYHAKKYLRELFASTERVDESLAEQIDILVSLMERKVYVKDEPLWLQGDDGDSAQLLVFGELESIIEETGACEVVKFGNLVGELGLVHGTKRFSTLLCSSEKAVLFSINKQTWQFVKEEYPQIARMVDGVVIRYLAHRVQHVNNRYFHTTLPV